jgi:hypothetical protein
MIEDWQKVYDQMRPYVRTILDWLQNFLSGSNGTPPPPTMTT